MNEADRERLISAARTAMDQAYAPYSGFRVGAAVLTSDGRVFAGCNVENASYPVTLCAERAALAAAVCAGLRDFEAVAIVTESLCPPCGMCRQALAEFGSEWVVILADPSGSSVEYRLRDLLPKAFTPEFLENDVVG